MEEAKEAVEHPMADTDLYFDKLTIRCRTGQNPNCTIAAQSRSQCADGWISNIRANSIHDETNVYFYSDQRWNDPSSAICVGRMHLCHPIVLSDALQGTQRAATTTAHFSRIIQSVVPEGGLHRAMSREWILSFKRTVRVISWYSGP